MISAKITGQLMECYSKPSKDIEGNPTTEFVSVLYVRGGSAIKIVNCNLLDKYALGDIAEVNVDIFNGKSDLFIRKSKLQEA